MTIKVDEDFVGMWFVQWPPPATMDFMAGLRREGDHYLATWRFRYYDPEDPDNDAFSEKDEKHWYEAKVPVSEGEALALKTMRTLVKRLTAACSGKDYEILMNPEKNVEQFMDVMRSMPWVHSKTLKEKP